MLCVKNFASSVHSSRENTSGTFFKLKKMKQLTLKHPHFTTLINDFKTWLDILGYAPTTVYGMPLFIQELLYYLEKNHQTHITQLTNQTIKTYYQQLKQQLFFKQTPAST